MGCGCKERAERIEKRTGIPAPLQHLAVGVAGSIIVLVILTWFATH